MKRLQELPEIAARQLGGLEAGPTLLCKVKLSAAEASRKKARPIWQPILAACAALVLCVGAVSAALNGLNTTPEDETETARISMIASHSAGEGEVLEEEPAVSADVPRNSLSMKAGGSASGALFANGDGSSFPHITAGGATYRMLASPTGISSSMLGEALGKVGEFNIEPALGTSEIVSNTVALNQTVYAVAGMNGAMIAAEVGGSLRVFQRVSYAGTAIIGGESLRDTLCGEDDARALRWEGIGEITDEDTVNALMSILLDGSDYRSTGMSGSGSLQIELKNGLTLQLLVGDDTVSACGTWDCPDFFEAFHEAVGR